MGNAQHPKMETTMPDLAPGEGLRIGAGIIRWKGDNDAVKRDLGEFSKFEVTSDLTKLEYKSNKLGAKSVVKSIITEKKATLAITLNSVTALNLALALGGTPDTVTTGLTRFGFLKNNVAAGYMYLEGTNDEGDQIDFAARVELAPNGTYGPISDSWNELPMEGTIIADDNGNFGFWDHRPDGVDYEPPDLEA
jgi:hypothetical protein